MATNTITLTFQPCEPTPLLGYIVSYRPVGSSEPYRVVEGNFFVSPIVFSTDDDPVGTSYEGFIQGDCGDGTLGVPVPWQGINGESASASASGGGDSSEAPPSNNIVIENSSLDVNVTEFTLDGVNVPTSPTPYAAPGNSSGHTLATAPSVNVHVEWSNVVGGQNILLFDTNGTTLACENIGAGDPTPEFDWLGVDMTGPNPLALVIGDGACS